VSTNYNLIRFIRQNIYTLKREYGGSITIYKLLDASTNLDSGTKTYNASSYEIKRAVVLPVRIMRHVIQSISLISANKKIVQGGTFDMGDRVFIVDRRDVPSTLELMKDDWIIYDDRRYDIKSIEEYEQKTAWLIVGKLIAGVVPEQHRRNYNTDTLNLTQTATPSIV